MFQKLWLDIKEHRMPWRLRIALIVLGGFLHNPLKAVRAVRGVGMDAVSLRRFQFQIYGLGFLRVLMEEAARLEMRPFLLWGTLLGFVREGGFLRHDYDVDLAILEEDYPKKDALIRAMRSRGYRLRHDVPRAFSFEMPDRFLHLDVDVAYAKDGKMITSAYFGVPEKDSAHEFPADAFEPLERRPFPGGVDVWVPAKPEKILESIYGNWRVPVKTYDYKTGPQNRIQSPTA